jgi:hypothetical protein
MSAFHLPEFMEPSSFYSVQRPPSCLMDGQLLHSKGAKEQGEGVA